MLKEKKFGSDIIIKMQSSKKIDDNEAVMAVLKVEQALNSLPPFSILLEDEGIFISCAIRFHFKKFAK